MYVCFMGAAEYVLIIFPDYFRAIHRKKIQIKANI